MAKQKVINRKYLPTRFPVVSTISIITACDYWGAPQWLWGVVITLLGIIWVSVINRGLDEEEFELTPPKYERPATQKFEERLNNALNNKP